MVSGSRQNPAENAFFAHSELKRTHLTVYFLYEFSLKKTADVCGYEVKNIS